MSPQTPKIELSHMIESFWQLLSDPSMADLASWAGFWVLCNKTMCTISNGISNIALDSIMFLHVTVKIHKCKLSCKFT